MTYFPLSDLEQKVYDAFGRFSEILGRLQDIDYDVKMKKSASGMTHISIRPQRGYMHIHVVYPKEIRIPKSGDYILMEDISGGIQKRFVKYLHRELPGLVIKDSED